jgi:hypothetical protein
MRVMRYELGIESTNLRFDANSNSGFEALMFYYCRARGLAYTCATFQCPDHSTVSSFDIFNFTSGKSYRTMGGDLTTLPHINF